MASGGPRVATPGKSYSNRTDLGAQPITTATGQPYGAAGAQRAQQAAVPLPQAGVGPGAGGVAALPVPGANGGLYRDSERPGEPVHAGLDQGLAGLTDDRDLLEALFERYPTAGLSRLLESLR